MAARRKPLPPPEDFTGYDERDDRDDRPRQLKGDGNLGDFIYPEPSRIDRCVDGLLFVTLLVAILLALLIVVLVVINALAECSSVS